jgi:hypothetical protein
MAANTRMITRDELIRQISATIGKLKVLELSVILKKQDFALRDLIDLTFHPDKDIAFRAAWILENLFLQNPENYGDDLKYLLSRVGEVKHASCQRHYAKILMHITAKKAPKSILIQLQEIDMEPIVEKCFDWMIDPKIKIAVKVFSSEVLFNLKDRYPWIKEELANQLRFLMLSGTAAIQTRGKKLLRLL